MQDVRSELGGIEERAGGALVGQGESRLRLQTIVRLRWLAVLGQFAAVCFVYVVLGFSLPVGFCLGIIALSAWLNVFMAVKFPARHRLSSQFATVLLAYDILQLAALLYLTGGVENPFLFLIVAPVTVSAATLPAWNTVLLGSIASAVATLLVFEYWPLPWYSGMRMQMPLLYKIGILLATVSGLVFLALYAWRLAKEAQQMSAALAATELVLSREQRLHALDGLAAAAAHELGTPLSTIVLVTKELQRDKELVAQYGEDIALLRSQADRCREILKTLTRRPSDQDPLHSSISVRELIEEAAAPHHGFGIVIDIKARPAADADEAVRREPIGERRPGMIYGIGNIVENAVDYAEGRVEIDAEWGPSEIVVTVSDDGPGFPPDVIDTLGEPFVSRRGSAPKKRTAGGGGLGLGFFIAKTLLERSGASVSLSNRAAPRTGAIVKVSWPRTTFDPGTRPPEVASFGADRLEQGQ